MKTIAILEVDLVRTPLGTRSRLSDPMHGRPLLVRTLERIAQAKRLAECHIVCPDDQAGRCQSLLEGVAVRIHGHQSSPPPYRELTRVGRKWSLDAWRGGIGGVCAVDEYTHCPLFAGLATQVGADAVWTAPPASPLVDPRLIDEMIAHYESSPSEMRLVFAQAPPGLTGVILQTGLLAELAEKRTSPGWVLAYKPDAPAMDLALKECCFPTSQNVRHAAGRLVADTDRSWKRVGDLIQSATDEHLDADTVGERLITHQADELPEIPGEVEIELTTDDQLPATLLRPRGPAGVGSRGPLDVEVIRALADELATVDDSRVVLGGFGEPLLHPRFAEIISILRQAGIYAIAVNTNGLALDDAIAGAMLDARVDVVSVFLDATAAETYRSLQGHDGLEAAKRGIDRLAAARVARHQVAPVTVAQLTKVRANLPEMESFVDEWLRRGIWPNVVGYSHRAGQCPERAVMSMAPPVRRPCRRLQSRLTVLADGTVTACDQDYAGKHAVGRLSTQGIGDIWRGAAMTTLRARHRTGAYHTLELCRGCDEWHRP